MTTSELVSVVVPVYNGGRFIAECLASLVAQDHPSVEVVVVDDGSTDASAEIAERFAPDVRLVRRLHEGVGAARNTGVEAASGSLIAFCDSDDWWKPHLARVLVAYLADHPEVDIVLCRQDTVIEPGCDVPDWVVPDQIYGDLDGVSPTSGLFRRTVFDKVRYRTDMQVGTETNLLVRARGAGVAIEVLDQSLRVRRIHDDNMTTRLGPGRSGMFETVREHLRNRR